MKRPTLLISILLGYIFPLFAQYSPLIDYKHQAGKVSFRGIDQTINGTIWISGSQGTVMVLDPNNQLLQVNPVGYEKRDFRAVAAIDDQTAVIMAIDNPAVLLKTTDRGKTWNKVYEQAGEGIFADAIKISSSGYGVCIGDPINGHMWMIETNDFGNSWQLVPETKTPTLAKGEAFFAASGTNVQIIQKGNNTSLSIVSGGMQSRLLQLKLPDYTLTNSQILPLWQGQETAGANGIWHQSKTILIAGGNFSKAKIDSGNYAISYNGGKSFIQSPSLGYLPYCSYMGQLPNKTLVACGTQGIYILKHKQKQWEKLTDGSFNTATIVGNSVIFAGGGGRISRWIVP